MTLATSALLVSGTAAAHADSPTDSSSVLYVDGSNTSCTDTGAGAGGAATPFCTIQPAADAAVPGDTVEISKGAYRNALDITSTGSAAASIVFQAVGGLASIVDGTGQTGPALTVDGASYVTFEGFEGVGSTHSQELGVSGVQITASDHITLDGAAVVGASNSTSGAVHVTGGSSHITVSRSIMTGATNGGILVDGGGSGDVFSTNSIQANAFGISVNGATGTAITSNSLYAQNADEDPISLASGATGATIENNIVSGLSGTASTTTSSIAVAADSRSGTVLDYNLVYPGNWDDVGVMQNAYSWGGATYSSASALFQATGQGQHDLNTDPETLSNLSVKAFAVPQWNSANGSAPGMLPTDLYGDLCTGNPLLAVTGSGTPAYCARGAFQPNYTVTYGHLPPEAIGARGINLGNYLGETLTDGTDPGIVSSGPTPAVSYTISWGDGLSQNVPASSAYGSTVTLHTYAEPGTYTITQTAHLTIGGSMSTTTSFTTVGSDYIPLNPVRLLDTRKGIGAPVAKVPAGKNVTVKIAGLDGIPADATAAAVNLTVADDTGNGYLAAAPGGNSTSTSNVNYTAGRVVANSAIVPLKNGSITIYNKGTGSTDMIADISGYFAQSAGDGYADATLKRILDTRKGIGAPVAQVAATTGIPVTVAGVDAIPSGVTAVAVHVTVADTTGSGWIAAEANGAGTPGTSILDYGKGQVASNTVIVPVASDGKIELYNGGGHTPVDLLADVSGYFTATAPGAYVPIAPTRVWDTRLLGWTIPAGGTDRAFLEGDNGDAPQSPFPANATLVLNTTVTNTKGTGYLTVYPYGTDGSGRPTVSNLNFNTWQTIANLAILPTSYTHQEVAVFNGSTGTADVVFDVFGYYANN
ncbi:right-handed parallel beta-helix repeat-containing protein [Streptacidiphilus cavernicola]|uniref:Right-handed parallel beta-helix repeat-containing protein n=1 Tax=Streptacidiphilus cavernicola TaxID=3342716 RepID=A0ABV6VQ52_9ACTN